MGKVKPDVVLFGELLPEAAMAEAQALCAAADLLLCVGSSLEVYPVAGAAGADARRRRAAGDRHPGPDALRRRGAGQARRRRRRGARGGARGALGAAGSSSDSPGCRTASSTSGASSRSASANSRGGPARNSVGRRAGRSGSASPSGSGRRPGGGSAPRPRRRVCGLRWPLPSFGPQPRDRQQGDVDPAGELGHLVEQVGVAGEVDAPRRRPRSRSRPPRPSART